MLRTKKILLLSLFASSLLIANETQTTLLSDITVNANKMEEDILDIPQSISVISEEELEQKGIKNVGDVINEIPNMDFRNIHGSLASFRGLNHSMFTSNNPVVVYIDGVPYYDRYDYNPSFANVEQIEVLRGPQGTIYGKDAIGAVINIITKKPNNQWNGTLALEYGKLNTLNTKVNASGALVQDKLFAGINGSFYKTDGWIKNNYPNKNKHANKNDSRKTSAFLLYRANDSLSTRLTLENNETNTYFEDKITTSDTSKKLDSFTKDELKNASYDMPNHEKAKVNAQALNISYEKEKFKFESTTTHKKSDFKGIYDGDFLSDNISDGTTQFNTTDLKTLTQEFKLSSKNQDIKWVAGLYFDKEERKQGPYGYEYIWGSKFYENADSITNTKTQAIFGQTMIPLSSSFELTLGARYQKIKKDMKAEITKKMDGVVFNNFSYEDKKEENAFLPKLALNYKVNDNLSTFISISKGYMPGGFNYFPSNANSEENTFKAQKSVNYEIGAKYIGETYAFNANIFRMNIEDIHFYKIVGSSYIADNAKKAHSQGIELDGTYFINDNLSLFASLGLIEAKYDDYDMGTKKFDGEKIENTPRYKASFGISYLADNGIYGRLDFNARGKTSFYNGAMMSMVEAKGALISNAKLGYKTKTFDIYTYINNISDEKYPTFYMSKPGLAVMGVNTPRTFGLGAIYKF